MVRVKKQWIVSLLVAAALSAGGCTAHQSKIEGCDMFDAGLTNLDNAFVEQKADDVEHKAVVEANLSKAFANDVVACNGDKAQVQAKTAEFIATLQKNHEAFTVKDTRVKNARSTITGLREIVGLIRTMEQIRLGWKTEAIQYSDKLRDLMLQGSSK